MNGRNRQRIRRVKCLRSRNCATSSLSERTDGVAVGFLDERTNERKAAAVANLSMTGEPIRALACSRRSRENQFRIGCGWRERKGRNAGGGSQNQRRGECATGEEETRGGRSRQKISPRTSLPGIFLRVTKRFLMFIRSSILRCA